jgi:hypothetical protein
MRKNAVLVQIATLVMVDSERCYHLTVAGRVSSRPFETIRFTESSEWTSPTGYGCFFIPSLAIAILPVRTNSFIPIGLRSSTIASIFFSSPVISMV